MLNLHTEIVSEHVADVVGLGLYLAVTLGYYAVFTCLMRVRPDSLLQGRMQWYRHNWIRLVYQQQDGIRAVQTFRNQLMSSSFLASTAILVVIGLLTFLRLPPEAVSFFYGDLTDPSAFFWLLVNVVMLIGVYSYNFLSFAVCIRDLNHLSCLSGLYGLEDPDDVEGVILHMEYLYDHVGMNHTRGLRGYFFGLPLFFWLLSPYLMIATSFIILGLLYLRDRSHRRLFAR